MDSSRPARRKSVMALQKQYHLSDEMLTYSLDKNERARVEYDAEEEHCCWFSTYLSKKARQSFWDQPNDVYFKKKQIFTFAPWYPLCDSDDGALGPAKPQQTPLHFLFQSLFLISGTFFR